MPAELISRRAPVTFLPDEDSRQTLTEIVKPRRVSRPLVESRDQRSRRIARELREVADRWLQNQGGGE